MYDRIARTADFPKLLELEALTNPRAREESGNHRKIRPEDLPARTAAGTVVASFAYSGDSRFTDGTCGVYYAAHERETAIEESRYATERFLKATREPSIDVDKRVYTAKITGRYDDVRGKSMRSAIYDKNSYAKSQAYARALYEANEIDGIVYDSVRRSGGQCICVFRPRLVRDCKLDGYIQFRWDGEKIYTICVLLSL